MKGDHSKPSLCFQQHYRCTMEGHMLPNRDNSLRITQSEYLALRTLTERRFPRSKAEKLAELAGIWPQHEAIRVMGPTLASKAA